MGKWVLQCRNMLVNYHNQANLSAQEKIAVARGHFCLIVLRRWHEIAGKMAKFRKIMLSYYAGQTFKIWKETARLVKLGDLFVGSILRAFYRKGFSKMNNLR